VNTGSVFSDEKNGTHDRKQLVDKSEFTDIDNLFDGLTHELNALLTSAVDS